MFASLWHTLTLYKPLYLLRQAGEVGGRRRAWAHIPVLRSMAAGDDQFEQLHHSRVKPRDARRAMTWRLGPDVGDRRDVAERRKLSSSAQGYLARRDLRKDGQTRSVTYRQATRSAHVAIQLSRQRSVRLRPNECVRHRSNLRCHRRASNRVHSKESVA